WVTRTLVVQHPNEGIDFIQRHAATLHPRFASVFAFWLAHGVKEVPPNILKPWIVAIMALDSQATPHPLSDLLDKCCASAESVDVAFLLFQYLLRPRVRLKKRWSLSDTPD